MLTHKVLYIQPLTPVIYGKAVTLPAKNVYIGLRQCPHVNPIYLGYQSVACCQPIAPYSFFSPPYIGEGWKYIDLYYII